MPRNQSGTGPIVGVGCLIVFIYLFYAALICGVIGFTAWAIGHFIL